MVLLLIFSLAFFTAMFIVIGPMGQQYRCLTACLLTAPSHVQGPLGKTTTRIQLLEALETSDDRANVASRDGDERLHLSPPTHCSVPERDSGSAGGIDTQERQDDMPGGPRPPIGEPTLVPAACFGAEAWAEARQPTYVRAH